MPAPRSAPLPSGLPTGGSFTFGSFKIDAQAKRLFRDGGHVLLRGRQFEVLLVLVSRAGELLGKDELIRLAWEGAIVGDNTLTQTVSQLRELLDAEIPDRYIDTVRGHGYRFVTPVVREDASAAAGSRGDLQALLAPYKAWLEGRAALETLGRPHLLGALPLLQQLVAVNANNATFHVGLAMTYALLFESTRLDVEPDRGLLALAITHAEQACRLRPDYAEAYAALGFALDRAGRRAEAYAALRRSVELQPTNWRLHVRLGYAVWGEERLNASEAALALLPDCPMARFLAATVYVARGALAQAEAEIDAGIAAIPDTTEEGQPWAVALFWFKGLLCLARGAVDEAMDAFRRELALESLGHVYGRECAANTWRHRRLPLSEGRARRSAARVRGNAGARAAPRHGAGGPCPPRAARSTS